MYSEPHPCLSSTWDRAKLNSKLIFTCSFARQSGLDIPSKAHVSAALADVPRPIQEQVDAVGRSETDHQLSIQIGNHAGIDHSLPQVKTSDIRRIHVLEDVFECKCCDENLVRVDPVAGLLSQTTQRLKHQNETPMVFLVCRPSQSVAGKKRDEHAAIRLAQPTDGVWRTAQCSLSSARGNVEGQPNSDDRVQKDYCGTNVPIRTEETSCSRPMRRRPLTAALREPHSTAAIRQGRAMRTTQENHQQRKMSGPKDGNIWKPDTEREATIQIWEQEHAQ